MKDITDEIEVTLCHTKSPRGGRLAMRHNGKTIGVLKSSGWDLKKEYTITYHPHPLYPRDDSWFTIQIWE